MITTNVGVYAVGQLVCQEETGNAEGDPKLSVITADS